MHIIFIILLKFIATVCMILMWGSLDQWAKYPEEKGYGTQRRFWSMCAITNIIIIWIL